MTFYHWTHGCDVNVLKNYLNKSAYPKLVIMKSKGTLLFLKKMEDISLFVEPLTYGDVFPGFQNQGGFFCLIACMQQIP